MFSVRVRCGDAMMNVMNVMAVTEIDDQIDGMIARVSRRPVPLLISARARYIVLFVRRSVLMR